jgi:hypothetical protein
MNKPKKLRELKYELDVLNNLNNAPEVIEAKKKVAEARKPQIEALEKQIEALRSKRPEKTPRWPKNTPENVLKAAEAKWKGTTEFSTYRIHLWNSKAFWTSWPSGGYSTNGGWVKAPACFKLVSLIETERAMGRVEGIELATLTGRVSIPVLRSIMVEKTEEEPHDIG